MIGIHPWNSKDRAVYAVLELIRHSDLELAVTNKHVRKSLKSLRFDKLKLYGDSRSVFDEFGVDDRGIYTLSAMGNFTTSVLPEIWEDLGGAPYGIGKHYTPTLIPDADGIALKWRFRDASRIHLHFVPPDVQDAFGALWIVDEDAAYDYAKQAADLLKYPHVE